MAFWHDMGSLFDFALGDIGGHLGLHSCYCLKLLPQVAYKDSCVFIKAEVDDEAQIHCATSGPMQVTKPEVPIRGGKLVLLASYQDYEAVLRHVERVKVLRAFVDKDDNDVVLDATGNICFFSGAVPTRIGETLQIAEIFAGGFGGWPRAVATLKEEGVKAHVSWMLERDPSCFPPLLAMDS